MLILDQTTMLLVGSVAIVSFVGLVGLVVTSRSAPVEERVADLRDQSHSIRAQRPNSLTEQSKQELRQAWSQKEERRKKFGERLVQAGLYKRGSTGVFIATQIALCAMPVAIGILAASFHYTTSSNGILAGLCLGVLGMVGPGLWLDAMKRKRQTVIRRSLPDALDLLVVCVEAGLSLPAAMVRVTKELRTAYPMLAMELIIVHREVQLGASSGEALRRFADRFDLEELRSLSSVIRQAEKFGASITKAIQVHADTLRHRRMEQARQRAQQAAVKLLFPTVLCIFPAVFVVILGPAVYDIMEAFGNMRIPTAVGQ
jgi:tight adherence protein C